MIPAPVAAAYGFANNRIERVRGGLINDTFAVLSSSGDPVASVARLHPVFSAEVNTDIDAITAHLAAAGLETPRVLRTVDGALWIEHEEAVWRALSWVPGDSISAVDSPERARAAGRLVGRFHKTVADLDYTFRFSRLNVHDTAGFLARLREHVAGEPRDDLERAARDLGREILSAAGQLPALGRLPRRICHGDLKISNLVFRGDEAVCLIDLDTLGLQTIAYEMGDALRSWCNPLGEDVESPSFDEAILDASLDGYLGETGDLLSAAERDAIVPGAITVCVELAARFCNDVFDDSYFGWDPDRFDSRKAHNLVRAQGQLALATSRRV